MNVDELKRNLRNVIERYRNKEEFTGEVCRDAMARDCLHVVEELEAENARLKAQVPKWIRVKDRLPKDESIPYLVRWKESYNANPFMDSDYAILDFMMGRWNDGFGEEWPGVTHWMPLPPPPTEESSATERENG